MFFFLGINDDLKVEGIIRDWEKGLSWRFVLLST